MAKQRNAFLVTMKRFGKPGTVIGHYVSEKAANDVAIGYSTGSSEPVEMEITAVLIDTDKIGCIGAEEATDVN